MREIMRTNDRVLISAVEALLKSAGIETMVFDQNMSVLEGSLGMLQTRVLVADGYELRARQLLQDAGLGHELRHDGH
jgi:Putative prokaryotic signal transducing protein